MEQKNIEKVFVLKFHINFTFQKGKKINPSKIEG